MVAWSCCFGCVVRKHRGEEYMEQSWEGAQVLNISHEGTSPDPSTRPDS